MKQPTRQHPDLSASEAAIESDPALRLKANLISLSGMEHCTFYIIHKTGCVPYNYTHISYTS